MIGVLQNIRKEYKIAENKIRRVLVNVSLEIKKAETIGIIGPSGSGKSTLLNILGTIDKPDSGIIRINGLQINDLSENDLAQIRNRSIGFVFQMHHLLPQLNLIENVLLPTIPLKDKTLQKKAYNRAVELLDFVGLADNLKQLPGQLSGGECQRAAVVRALINKPDLILADEPTGSLDEENAEILSNLLVKLNREQGLAMVVVTHSVQLAEKMQVSYLLKNGILEKL